MKHQTVDQVLTYLRQEIERPLDEDLVNRVMKFEVRLRTDYIGAEGEAAKTHAFAILKSLMNFIAIWANFYWIASNGELTDHAFEATKEFLAEGLKILREKLNKDDHDFSTEREQLLELKERFISDLVRRDPRWAYLYDVNIGN